MNEKKIKYNHVALYGFIILILMALLSFILSSTVDHVDFAPDGYTIVDRYLEFSLFFTWPYAILSVIFLLGAKIVYLKWLKHLKNILN